MGTKVIAIYNEGVLKPMKKLDLAEKAKVRITISENFSKLLDEIGEIEAKEDIGKVLENMKTRSYYE
ncbi:MAG: antitoxin family protein [Halobacteriota archaeon]